MSLTRLPSESSRYTSRPPALGPDVGVTGLERGRQEPAQSFTDLRFGERPTVHEIRGKAY